MSRSAATGKSVQPIVSTDDTIVPVMTGQGRYTLVANTTYRFILDGSGSPWVSATITGYTAGLIITSATIEDTDHPIATVPRNSAVVGEWIPETPTTAVVGVTGTGWSATNGVVAAAGTGIGGARWNLEGTAAFRTRITVVVGATGGDVRLSWYEKN